MFIASIGFVIGDVGSRSRTGKRGGDLDLLSLLGNILVGMHFKSFFVSFTYPQSVHR